MPDRLSTRSDALVLLSATPHDGSRQSFASLMRMLDPTSIADPEDYGPDDIKGLFLRRFRTTPAVKAALKGKVKPRVTKRIEFAPSQTEEAAYDILARLNLHEDAAVHRKGQRLFKTLLEKALFSSPAACAETIEKRLKKLETDQAPASIQDASALRELLNAVLAIDTDAFSKYRHIRALFTELKWSPKKKDDRIVIFSERIATLEWLAVRLREDLGLSEEQVKTLHASGVGADVKTNKIVEDFGIDKAPIRILLASDMASEGLNLHYLSNKLIHFDIPWALLKFQQRNGRIDRYGQERQPHIWYLVAQPAQPKIRGDLRILDRLIDKDEAAQENIGDPSAFLGTNDEQEQEDVVAEAIEAGKSADAFEAEMDNRAAETASSAVDHYAVLEAFFKAAQTTPAARADMPDKAGRQSVFEDTFAYAVTALTRVKTWKPDIHFDVDRKDRVITLSIPDDFRERSDFGGRSTRTVDARFMPPEAEPAEGRIKLTDNRQLMSERIRAARQGTGRGWPDFQYLWDVHPAIDWLSDKISGVFGRRQAPVVRIAGILQKEEVAFVFNGIVPNLKGQPLVDEWPVVVFSKSRFVRVETIRDFLNRTGIGRTELPNVGATQVDDLRPLVAEAVNQAQTFIHETRRELPEGHGRGASAARRATRSPSHKSIAARSPICSTTWVTALCTKAAESSGRPKSTRRSTHGGTGSRRPARRLTIPIRTCGSSPCSGDRTCRSIWPESRTRTSSTRSIILPRSSGGDIEETFREWREAEKSGTTTPNRKLEKVGGLWRRLSVDYRNEARRLGTPVDLPAVRPFLARRARL